MRLRFTQHALDMLEERRIEPDWVARTLERPERLADDPRGPPLRRAFGAVPEAGGRILRVVFRMEDDLILVVTAHFDRGARP